MTEPTTNEFMFRMDDGIEVSFVTPLTLEEVAEELQLQAGGGYVCDDDVIVPVRRVVCVKRTLVGDPRPITKLSVEQVEKFVGKYEGEERLTGMERTALTLARDWLVMRYASEGRGHDCTDGMGRRRE